MDKWAAFVIAIHSNGAQSGDWKDESKVAVSNRPFLICDLRALKFR